MKMLTLLFAIITPALVAQGSDITKEKVNEMGARGNRYTAVEPFEKTDWSVFGGQPRYNPATPEMLNGYQKSTAEERGITEVWNEVGQGVAVKVKLSPSEVVLYMGDQYYLDNCRWLVAGTWVDFKNRIKPILPEPPPPAPAPEPAAEPTPEPAPKPQPEPELEPEPEVHMPPITIPQPPEELINMPPALGPPPSREYVATLVWEGKNKKWYWTWTPLWCVDVHSKKDLYKPAVCAAAAVGGYWLAGGFHATALYKAIACVTTTLPNGSVSSCMKP